MSGETPTSNPEPRLLQERIIFAEPHIPDLPAALRDLLNQVPPGRATTYGDLAEALGDLAAARWVAEWTLDHPHAPGCPCFRVVRRTGETGLFITRNPADKTERLADDGVAVNDGRIDLNAFGFAQFQSQFPLRRLQRLQAAVQNEVVLEPLDSPPAIVAGVDVAYSRGTAVAACVLVDAAAGNLIAAKTVRQPAAFPYISGYLSFRELPGLLAAVNAMNESHPPPDVCFVDGNGILHPRGAGAASHFGVATGLRTIGIGKKLLCGSVDLDGLQPGESRPVTLDGRCIGAAVKAGPTSRPIFVSPGHRMNVDSAVDLTQRLFRGRRLPEPVHLADRMSRQGKGNAELDNRTGFGLNDGDSESTEFL